MQREMTFCAIPSVRPLLVKLSRGFLTALLLFFMVALSCTFMYLRRRSVLAVLFIQCGTDGTVPVISGAETLYLLFVTLPVLVEGGETCPASNPLTHDPVFPIVRGIVRAANIYLPIAPARHCIITSSMYPF